MPGACSLPPHAADLTIRKSPAKHQRVPSHEAILKVAKQHKLPAPQLPQHPPPLPPQLPRQAAGPPTVAVTLIDAAPAVTSSGCGSSGQTLLPDGAPASSIDGAPPAAAASAEAAESVDDAATQASAAAQAVHGEPWQARKERVRGTSPYGRRPGWDLRCVIVKTGDDCRQELLAMQLIRAFHEIFGEAQLPLWLRPYEVLVTSNRTALIEMIPNAPSIHAIKAKSPTSLRGHMLAKFGPGGEAVLSRALRNFTESLAAYSLICYLLQIKDRWVAWVGGEGGLRWWGHSQGPASAPGSRTRGCGEGWSSALVGVLPCCCLSVGPAALDGLGDLLLSSWAPHWTRPLLLCALPPRSPFPFPLPPTHPPRSPLQAQRQRAARRCGAHHPHRLWLHAVQQVG